MVDDIQSTLTPDEVGAFVAQWAERKNVDLAELSRLLGVDEQQAASLLRQARGRLHMYAWLNEKRTPAVGAARAWAIGIAFLLFGLLAGGMVSNYLNNPSAQPQQTKLDEPNITVSTTTPEPGTIVVPPRKPPINVMRVAPVGNPLVGNGDLMRTNPDAARLGARIGSMIADETLGLGQRPLTPPSGFGGMGGGMGVGRGGPAPQGQTEAGGTNLQGESPDVNHIYHDMTNQLRTPLPPDVVVVLVTPTDYYRMHGQFTSNPEFAGRIQARDLILPMSEVVNFAANFRGQALQVRRRRNPTLGARIVVSVGNAKASVRLPWDDNDPSEFQGYKDANNRMYADLAREVLAGIQSFGQNLFRTKGN